MKIDLRQTPFTRADSYMSFGIRPSDGRPNGELWLRNVHGYPGRREALAVRLLADGADVPFKATATESVLRMDTDAGWVEMCLPEPNLLRIRGRGVTLRLIMEPQSSDNAIYYGGGRWLINARSMLSKYLLTPLVGNLSVDAPWQEKRCLSITADFAPDTDGRLEAAIDECPYAVRTGDHERSFDQCVSAVGEEFGAWRRRLPQLSGDLAEAGDLAAYVLWSATVPPEGFLTRRGILMSKNHMDRVFSWDYLFNAMALADSHPDLAWDQVMLMFDIQSAAGHFPDFVSDHHWQWNYVKPPIQGWALRWMMRHSNLISQERLREVYRPLSRWTEWWFEYRDSDGDGLPQYDHGNDSGWDNATCFAIRPPIEGPDLAAYLAVQMDVLAEIAGKLGLDDESAGWTRRADELVEKLLEHSFNGESFTAPQSGTHETADEGDTLLVFLPLVLGERLPEDIRRKLIDGLKQPGRFLTDHGLATESPNSPLYEPNGYWRGPIWAPPTMVLVDALTELGEKELAADIAGRFCRTCAASGMAENFDALTGEGLRDRAYTWTAAVFFILASEYIRK
ncbi:MAG: amylo-alpha-1,6-glucosidase [Phycisphaerae bacterium]